jgi:hypothetical protein
MGSRKRKVPAPKEASPDLDPSSVDRWLSPGRLKRIKSFCVAGPTQKLGWTEPRAGGLGISAGTDAWGAATMV